MSFLSKRLLTSLSKRYLTWESGYLPAGNYHSSIAYGNGKFVAVRMFNTLGVSTATPTNIFSYVNGSSPSWSQGTMPSSQFWSSVTYGNGKFVAVSFDSSVAAYSNDGINWTETTLPSVQGWGNLVYGNGRFIAFGGVKDFSSNVAAYSDNGINWNEITMPISGNWRCSTYGNSIFVVSSQWNVFYSSNGINWSQGSITPNLLRTPNAIAYGNGIFIGVSLEQSNFISYDGINWISNQRPSGKFYTNLAYGNGLFVAPVTNENKSNIVSYTQNGVEWYDGVLPATEEWGGIWRNLYGIAYGNNIFRIISGTSANLYTDESSGGNPSPDVLNKNWASVSYGNDKFVSIAKDSNSAAISSDGIAWNVVDSLPYNTDWRALAFGSGKFVALP